MDIHTDGIWISTEREKQTVKQLTEQIIDCGYSIVTHNSDNYGLPYEFVKGDTKLNCRLVGSIRQNTSTAMQPLDTTVLCLENVVTETECLNVYKKEKY